jgi:ABC-type multidrug transport system ATPase subunit
LDEIVEFSGLLAFIDTPVKRYSSGMFARLGFSVAAHVDPDVLLVDEVLSVGDYVFQRKCLDRMTQVIENGTTVVFISHNLRAVANLCTRSLLLRRGTTAMLGKTSEVLKKYLEGEERRSLQSGRDLEITNVVIHNQADPLFDTCTDRLGRDAIVLEAGQRVTATFEIEAGLAEGTFHVNGYLFRYTTNEAYDKWSNAATFFVSGAPAVRGSVNLKPRLVTCDVLDAPRIESAAPALHPDTVPAVPR